MNALYRVLNISKQSVHKYLNRLQRVLDERQQLIILIYQIREDHPTMGVRDMYYKIKPETMGRDAFELFCRESHMVAKRYLNYRRTTDSTGVIRFDNLIEGMTTTGINQIRQSDITYFEVSNVFYYITFIIDGHSRRIIGYSVSRRLLTEHTTLPAMYMAIATRNGQSLYGVIVHSDGGGQYYDKAFLMLTGKYGMQNSMCEYAWENGKAERINGVIKNNYLIHREIRCYEQLVKEVDRSVQLYNNEKPHISLKRLTPVEFENKYFYTHQKPIDESISNQKQVKRLNKTVNLI